MKGGTSVSSGGDVKKETVVVSLRKKRHFPFVSTFTFFSSRIFLFFIVFFFSFPFLWGIYFPLDGNSFTLLRSFDIRHP